MRVYRGQLPSHHHRPPGRLHDVHRTRQVRPTDGFPFKDAPRSACTRYGHTFFLYGHCLQALLWVSPSPLAPLPLIRIPLINTGCAGIDSCSQGNPHASGRVGIEADAHRDFLRLRTAGSQCRVCCSLYTDAANPATLFIAWGQGGSGVASGGARKTQRKRAFVFVVVGDRATQRGGIEGRKKRGREEGRGVVSSAACARVSSDKDLEGLCGDRAASL